MDGIVYLSSIWKWQNRKTFNDVFRSHDYGFLAACFICRITVARPCLETQLTDVWIWFKGLWDLERASEITGTRPLLLHYRSANVTQLQEETCPRSSGLFVADPGILFFQFQSHATQKTHQHSQACEHFTMCAASLFCEGCIWYLCKPATRLWQERHRGGTWADIWEPLPKWQNHSRKKNSTEA